MGRTIKKLKGRDIDDTKIVAVDHFIPDDEKIPIKMNDPDDLPDDDPFENPTEEPPIDGEGP